MDPTSNVQFNVVTARIFYHKFLMFQRSSIKMFAYYEEISLSGGFHIRIHLLLSVVVSMV